jgi:acetoacetate decarboxylase
MGLVFSPDDIARYDRHYAQGFLLGDTVLVSVVFQTTAEVVQRLLPPPLEPASTPTGYAYVAEFHRTNFGVAYNEAALFLSAQHNGEVGWYCLSMPVTDDMALIHGREIYGFPKKLADTIRVTRSGNAVNGVCIRKGIPIIEITATLTGPATPDDAAPPTPFYLFKHFPNPNMRVGSFDYPPRLIKFRYKSKTGTVKVGKGELTLTLSRHDPLYEIPVEAVLSARYVEGLEIQMRPGEVVAEVDPATFQPYAFSTVDSGVVL